MSLKVITPGGSPYENHPQIGDIQPGWTQTFSATPHVVGDSGGSVSSTRFSAVARADSDILLGKPIDATGDSLTTLGDVYNVGLNGSGMSATSYGVDAALLPRKFIPMVRSGTINGAATLLAQVYGLNVCQSMVGYGAPGTGFWSLTGHDIGFSADGANTMLPNGMVTSSTSFQMPVGDMAFNAPIAMPVGNNAARIRFRTKLPAPTPTNFATVVKVHSGPDDSGTGTGKTMAVTVDRATMTLSIDLKYRNGGISTTISDSVSISGLNVTQGIEVGITMGYTTTASVAPFRLTAYAFDIGTAPATPAQASVTSATTPRDPSWGGVASFAAPFPYGDGTSWNYLSLLTALPGANSSTGFVEEYGQSSSIVNSTVYNGSGLGPFPPYTGSGWEYLKMLCSAFAIQASVVGSNIVIKNIVDPNPDWRQVVDTISPVSVSINGAGRARSVDITNQRSTRANGSGTPYLYNSFPWGGGDDRVFRVSPGEELFAQVKINGYASKISKVSYQIEDSDGKLLDPSGPLFHSDERVSASIVGDGSILSIYVRGWDSNDPSILNKPRPTPWNVRVFVEGWGMLTDPEQITIYSGAPEQMVTQESGGTVNNIFLVSKEIAFERGVWAAQAAGGTEISISFERRIGSENPYTLGEIVTYGYMSFRIMSVSHANGVISYTAINYSLTGAHDSASNAIFPYDTTVADFDAYWAGQRCIDGEIRALRGRSEVIDPATGAIIAADDRPWVRPYPSVPQQPGLV